MCPQSFTAQAAASAHLGGVKGADPFPVSDVAHAAEDAEGAADDAHREDDERGDQEVVEAHLHQLRGA